MRTLAVLASLLVLVSCGDGNNGNAVDSPSVDTAAVSPNGNSWRELTESWNASLNLRNAPIMKSFYADSVLYYGDHLSADDVVRRQEEYFAMNPDYKQKIVEYVDEIQQPDGSWLIKIIKQVTANQKTNEYPASLVFSNEGGIWKITAESDDITDLNKARNIEVAYSPAQSTIEGLLEENTTFGAMNGNDPKSDSKTPYYVIWSKHSLDIVATAEEEKKGMNTLRNIERIQLVGGNAEEIRRLLNRKVRITGKIERASAPEHYTSVVLNVELIEEVL